MLGFHIAKDFDGNFWVIFALNLKLLVSVLLLLISEEIVCHIVAVNCAIFYVPVQFILISLMSFFNLANNFKPNNSADRIFPCPALP